LVLVEEEQQQILDGVIIEITHLPEQKRRQILNSSQKIIDSFPGSQYLTFKWYSDNDPFTQEPVLTMATSDDGFVDADNLKLYEYIFEILHSTQ
jgi:hypothetical protein